MLAMEEFVQSHAALPVPVDFALQLLESAARIAGRFTESFTPAGEQYDQLAYRFAWGGVRSLLSDRIDSTSSDTRLSDDEENP